MNMCPDHIREAVIQAVSESLAFRSDEIYIDSRLVEDLGMDSLDFLDIMFALEKKLDMKIRDADFDGVLNPGKSKTSAEPSFLTDEEIEQLSLFIPLLKPEAREREIPRRDLFSLATIETLIRMVERKISGP